MNEELKPIRHKDEFERFCCEVAKVVFGDFLASRYGRNGQRQSGIDVRATDFAGGYGRVVIQCKFNETPDSATALKNAAIELERDFTTAAKELTGDLDFDTFVFAGLWPADTGLDKRAKELSAQTRKTVQVWSLEVLQRYVATHARLKRLFARGVFDHGVLLLDHDFWMSARETPPDPLVYYAAQGSQSGGQQWAGLVHQLDAPRVCVPAIEERLNTLLPLSANLQRKVVAVVHGEGGSGKSTALRRIAFNRANNLGEVCWWITDLDQFIENDALSIGDRPQQKHLLFIEDWYRNVGTGRASAFFSWLNSQSNVLVVVGDRTVQGRAYMNHLYGLPTKSKPSDHEALFALAAGENQLALRFVLQRLQELAQPGVSVIQNLLNDKPQLLIQAPLFIGLYVLCHEAASGAPTLNLADGVQARFASIISKQLHLLEASSRTRGLGRALYVQAAIYAAPNSTWQRFSETTLEHTANFLSERLDSTPRLNVLTHGIYPANMAALVHRSNQSASVGHWVRFNHDLIAEVGIGQAYATEQAGVSGGIVGSFIPQEVIDTATLLSLFTYLLEKQDSSGALQLFCYLAHENEFEQEVAHQYRLTLIDLHVERKVYPSSRALLNTCRTDEEKRLFARAVLADQAWVLGLGPSAPPLMRLMEADPVGIETARKVLAHDEFWKLPSSIVATALNILGKNDEDAKGAARKVLAQDEFWKLPFQVISTALNILGAGNKDAERAALTVLRQAKTVATFLIFSAVKVLAETGNAEAMAVLQTYLIDLYNKPTPTAGEFRLRHDLLYLPLFFSEPFLKLWSRKAKGYRSDGNILDLRSIYRILHCQVLFGEQTGEIEHVVMRLCQKVSQYCVDDVWHQWRKNPDDLSLMHIGLAFLILNRPDWQLSALAKLQLLGRQHPDLGMADQFKGLLLVLQGKVDVLTQVAVPLDSTKAE